MSVFKSD